VDGQDVMLVASLAEMTTTGLTLPRPVPLKRGVPDSVRAAGMIVKLAPGEQFAHVVDDAGAFEAAGLEREPCE